MIGIVDVVRGIVYLAMAVAGTWAWHTGQMSLGRVLLLMVLVPLLEFVPPLVDAVVQAILRVLSFKRRSA